MKFSLFFVFLIFSSLLVNSQDIDISPITIKGEKYKDVFFLNKADTNLLRNKTNKPLSEILAQNSSVNVKTNGTNGISTISFRGTSASHTQVFWNDIPMNSSMSGQTDLSIIPSFFIDQVSFAYGINSLAYNSGSLGGSVYLNSITDLKQPFCTFMQSLNSYHNYSTFVNLNKNFKQKFLLNLRFMNSFGKNDFKYFNFAIPPKQFEKMENADFKQFAILFQTSYFFKNNFKLNFLIWNFNSYRNLPPIMSFDGLARNEFQNDNKLFFAVNLNKSTKKYYLKLKFAYLKAGLNYFSADSVISFPHNIQIIKNNSFSSEKSIFSFCDFSYFFDKDIFVNISDRFTFSNVNNRDSAIANENGYEAENLQNDLKLLFSGKILNQTFNLVTGFIVKSKSQIYSTFALEISNFSEKKLFTYKISTGKNIHVPTLNDLYWLPGGNPDLKPEKSYSSEGSVKLSKSFNDSCFAAIEISPFLMYVYDWILWKPTEFNYWTAENLKNVFSRGLETQFYIKFKKAYVNYTFTYTCTTNQSSYLPDDQSINKQLIYIPKIRSNLMIGFDFFNFDFYFSANYASRLYTTSSNEIYNSLSPTLNLNSGIVRDIKFKNFYVHTAFDIDNILNIQYQYVLYRPMPLRNFEFTVGFSF